MDASVSIIRRPVKHARLRVSEDGTATLIVPADFTTAEIESVLRKKAEWIERQREFFRANTGKALRLKRGEVMLFGEIYRWVFKKDSARGVVVDRESKVIRATGPAMSDRQREQWLRRFAGEHLRQRVRQLSDKHGFRYGRCFVRSQRTRWGNCSRKRNVSLNWRLVAGPEYVIDYVVLHELVHTLVMDHSHRFWVHLRAVCPDHAKASEWLHRNRTGSWAQDEA
jgi:predicted metal-dependent hydrolase